MSFSDPKCIDEIGKRKTFIKIGDYDFRALKLAFQMHEIRIKLEPIEYTHPRILSIKVRDGKFFKNTEIYFNEGLNSIIGVRGSGKSALIEIIRWVLGKSPISDDQYKQNIIKYVLGNTGKVQVELVGNNGQKYLIEKSIEDNTLYVYDYTGRLTELRDLGGIFDVYYYGQNDLSYYGQNPQKLVELIDNFIGTELIKLRSKEQAKLKEVKELVKKLQELKNVEGELNELKQEKAKLEERKKFFDQRGVSEKLEQQAVYEREDERFRSITRMVQKIRDNILDIKTNVKDTFDRILGSELTKFRPTWKEKYSKLREIVLLKLDEILNEIEAIQKSIETEEFAQFNREFMKIREELHEIKKSLDAEDIDTNYYLDLERELERIGTKINDLEAKLQEKRQLSEELNKKLDELANIRWEIYKLRKEYSSKINESISVIRISVEHKGDKVSFSRFVEDLFRGTGLRESKRMVLVEQFKDGRSLCNSLINETDRIKSILTQNELSKLKKKLEDNEALFKLLTYQPPDKVVIEYKTSDGKFKNIEKLSIGQRATALLSLVLLESNSPVIIDQPEDDIDNNTIYDAIIKKVLEKKQTQQFIFATHNSNIVVLGDSDNVIICKNEDNSFYPDQGSIDKKEIQKQIVNIMEGGKEAFENRKRIYNIWEA
ncbi:TrlF family AAA-like ATPase [Thermococcus paralvinellae]|uniref:DNA repair protein RecN n=1 Tax=Thermococcus paralvinellae TaxID=582419 RepID=W0I4X7_9EURY|nr:AAA family ATPase [Thermococcus paralvinellae]AHF81119.1 Hypothetical protein TES1_1744 [Thermococcus paralvinellae]